jgi:CheY-like chemotaxis protein
MMGPPRVPNGVGKVPASNSDKTVLSAAEEQPCQVYGYPTVLVVRDDEGLGGPLVNSLQRNGFHVLEADNWAHLLDVVKVHSRPIHLLLADVNMDASVPILKRHRSELQVLFLKKPVDEDDVLANVRHLLGSPPSLASIR